MLTEHAQPLTLAARPAPSTRIARKAATRAALLDAARDVLAEVGLDGTTSRVVAARAGVAHGTFFVHFADTAALVSALFDEHLATTLDRATRRIPDDLPVVEALVRMSKHLYDSYDAAPELARAFVAASLFRPDPLGPSGTRLDQYRRWVDGRLRAAEARGEIGPTDRGLVFEAYFSLYFGLLVAGLRGQSSTRRRVTVLRTTLTALVGAGR